MIRLYKSIRNVLSLCIFKILNPSTVIIYIETNIFGHAILEAEIAFQQVLTTPQDKYTLATHEQSANIALTNQMISIFQEERDIKHSKIANYAIQGKDVIRNRMKIDIDLKVLNYQSELTHQTASNISFQEPKLLQVIDSRIANIAPQYRNNLLVMNRSEAYKKYQEDSILHQYRNFTFTPLDEALGKSHNPNQFARIGSLDIRGDSSVIRDLRPQLAGNQELDLAVQLSSKGYFGADSGPCWAALVLDKPVGFINMIPLNQPCPIDPRKLVVIFKPLYSILDKRLLTLTEMVTPFISNLRSTIQYDRANIEPIENNKEDIAACLEDYMNLFNNPQNSDYDFEKMNWIREELNVSTLPSLSSRYLRLHPEIKV